MSQLLSGFERDAWAGGKKFTAARRMKGVVRPQARPTRMNPRVERMRDVGEEEEGAMGSICGMSMGEIRIYKVERRFPFTCSSNYP